MRDPTGSRLLQCHLIVENDDFGSGGGLPSLHLLDGVNGLRRLLRLRPSLVGGLLLGRGHRLQEEGVLPWRLLFLIGGSRRSAAGAPLPCGLPRALLLPRALPLVEIAAAHRLERWVGLVVAAALREVHEPRRHPVGAGVLAHRTLTPGGGELAVETPLLHRGWLAGSLRSGGGRDATPPLCAHGRCRCKCGGVRVRIARRSGCGEAAAHGGARVASEVWTPTRTFTLYL